MLLVYDAADSRVDSDDESDGGCIAVQAIKKKLSVVVYYISLDIGYKMCPSCKKKSKENREKATKRETRDKGGKKNVISYAKTESRKIKHGTNQTQIAKMKYELLLFLL
ncbi:uncharacterized protein ARB_01709 [Trichophyton benhamiae CBS 112371]|uniref:Uncharacterized protein n=1 Tax=Arthroderma benhamiae (strain ATCC MYA-4681 / CBS 112371) TaxID=663331 RepID=D4AZT9_ARTBC|nr:uncharacterized protein ARB_01709 [Trichophyton benhamiae CBS 112371]EFE31314.1 hypothetical protein ARB_01709 [Trichophyton benhamiae CBS 112371]